MKSISSMTALDLVSLTPLYVGRARRVYVLDSKKGPTIVRHGSVHEINSDDTSYKIWPSGN